MSLPLPVLPGALRGVAVFCKVVDNYGDIGICWRLARQLRQQFGLAVTLFVDDLVSFQRLCPALALDCDPQQVDGVTVRHWRDQDGVFAAAEVADLVIEFFACDIAPGYIAAMAQCQPRPVWLNLEGLSAEDWVEGCHTLPSPQPQGLVKHFFFPGFTARTGGLLREAELDQQRLPFQADAAAMAAFLAQYGVTAAERAGLTVSLFCYPHAPVAPLLAAWQDGATPVTCLVPEGVASAAVAQFLGGAATAGAARRRGMLSVRVLPFVAQPDYDRLLWACDVNFVRGEDSFVRAQWAGRPFVWHIYPQDEHLHHKKLRAFLHRYLDHDALAQAPGLASMASFSLQWNDAAAQPAAWGALWAQCQGGLPALAEHSLAWQRKIREHGDLAGNLLAFACTLR